MESFVRVSIFLLGILALITSIGARELPLIDYAESTLDALEEQNFVEHEQSMFDVTAFDAQDEESFIAHAQTWFDVTKYGAAGDGKTDDVKAFDSAWKAACAAGGSVTVTVPGGKNFLVSAVKFAGPCKSSQINFNILGNIVAPKMSAWKDHSADGWLRFSLVNGLVVDGSSKGTIDGQGNSWWQKGSSDSGRPTALRFSDCNNLHVKGLNHKDSPRNHVSIAGCKNVDLGNLKMQAPADSPNTDGIDLSGSSDIKIHDTVMATGDDCIAINGGTFNVEVWRVKCGPGHGISIGSLGKNGAHDQVSGINITDCTFLKSDNGVRIKTWQGGSGFAKDITFSNIKFVETNNPVIIDQYYCPNSKCNEKGSSVKISNVHYNGLRGTSASKKASVILNCSKYASCDNVILEDIDIKPAGSAYPNKAVCNNVKGQTTRIVSPDLHCVSR